MKVLKKAKIVNISLNSPQKHSPTLHLSRTSHQQHLTPPLFTEGLISQVYEVLRLIAHSRIKALHPHQEGIDKGQQEAFAAVSKGQTTSEVKIPLEMASAVETVLKMFITGRSQEEQGRNIGSSLKARQLSKKKSAKAFMQKSKENTQPAFLKTEEDQPNFFQGLARSNSGEKLSHKMQFLERQLQNYKQKVGEQSSTIARLELREILIKKKSQEQMRVARAKNIRNIHQLFQNEYRHNSCGKYLLNVNGSTFAAKSQKPIDSSIRSNTSEMSCNLPHSLLRQQKWHKPAEAGQQFQKYDKDRPLEDYQTSKTIKFQEGEGADQLAVPEAARKQRRTDNFKISLLRKELESLQQEKEKLFDRLTDINQQYQHRVDSFDQQILEKLREIRKEEELISDEELRMIGDNNFQAIQIYGLYQHQNLSHGSPCPQI